MTNRFRDKTMRHEYKAAVRAYRAGHRDLFSPDGSQHVGSSFASFFWRGFNGTTFGAGFTDRASRDSLAYAYYRAGQDCAKESQ